MFKRRHAYWASVLCVSVMGCGPSQQPGPAPPGPPQVRKPAVQVLVSVSGATVLKYEGGSVADAARGGNKLTPSKVLNDAVAVDKVNPLFGVLSGARVDINESLNSANAFESPVDLTLVRKSKDAVEWELTPEAIARIEQVKE